jgi:hypothetical protein
MNRLQKIEQEYPIKIEQYLGTKVTIRIYIIQTFLYLFLEIC